MKLKYEQIPFIPMNKMSMANVKFNSIKFNSVYI